MAGLGGVGNGRVRCGLAMEGLGGGAWNGSAQWEWQDYWVG